MVSEKLSDFDRAETDYLMNCEEARFRSLTPKLRTHYNGRAFGELEGRRSVEELLEQEEALMKQEIEAGLSHGERMAELLLSGADPANLVDQEEASGGTLSVVGKKYLLGGALVTSPPPKKVQEAVDAGIIV